MRPNVIDNIDWVQGLREKIRTKFLLRDINKGIILTTYLYAINNVPNFFN